MENWANCVFTILRIGVDATIKVASKKDSKEKSKRGVLKLKKIQLKATKLGVWTENISADGK